MFNPLKSHDGDATFTALHHENWLTDAAVFDFFNALSFSLLILVSWFNEAEMVMLHL